MLMLIKRKYLENTRPYYSEEPFDFFVYRPLAFCVVMLTQRLPLNPNHFSLLALMSAIFAGINLYHGNEHGFVLGSVGIFLFSVFDCCDGMVARLKKNGSELGELIDMFVDLLASICFYFGLYFGLKKMPQINEHSWAVFLSALSIFANATAYSFFKKQYFAIKDGNENWKEIEAQKYHELYEKLKHQKGNWFWCFLIKLFFGFSKVQKGDKKTRKFDRDLYLAINKRILPLWGISAGSTHLTVLAICLFFNQIELFYFITIGLFSVLPLCVFMIQLKLDKKMESA